MREDIMPVPANNINSNDSALLKLLGSLTELGDGVCGRQDDFMFLQQVLASPEFHALFNAHNAVKEHGQQHCDPVTSNSTSVMTKLCNDMLDFAMIPEVAELCLLLTRPHMRALFESHDKIADRDYIPQLPDVDVTLTPDDHDDDQEAIKIVRLVKGHEPLGATIKWDDVLGAIVIARVMHGGAADRSGLIHVGDIVYEVNGVDVRNSDPDDVVNLLSTADGTITFKLVPASIEKRKAVESQVRVKTYFDYNPYNDNAIPCPEAGLSFKKGEILHIVSQDDPMWWQARREGERGPRAGLIPSRTLQERRTVNNKSSTLPNNNLSTDAPIHRSSLRISTRSGLRGNKGKIKKIMYQAKKCDEFVHNDILTYEEVTPYLAVRTPRPIVLVGPPGVGRNELKRKLIASKPDHFTPAIPHTSRNKRWSEEDGKEYYYLDRSIMEEAIVGNRFLEYGEYKGNLYGTSFDTIMKASQAGQVCIINANPQSLKMLRRGDLKPYVIYIKPPSLDVLRHTRPAHRNKAGRDQNANRTFSDEELVNMIQAGVRMETLFKDCFDAVLVNDHLPQAFGELQRIVRKLEVEPHWVPSSWMR